MLRSVVVTYDEYYVNVCVYTYTFIKDPIRIYRPIYKCVCVHAFLLLVSQSKDWWMSYSEVLNHPIGHPLSKIPVLFELVLAY